MAAISPLTVLCLENNQSHFAASNEICNSDDCELVAATNRSSTLVALKAIPRINVAVLPCGKSTPEYQFDVAAEMETVRPGLPKIVIPPPAFTA